MSTADENSNKTSNPTIIDRQIDQSAVDHAPRLETYKDDVASKHVATQAHPSELRRSWTMQQVERAITAGVLPLKPQKIAQFGLNLSRANDFRLGDLSERLQNQLKRDLDSNPQAIAPRARARTLDLQSQTMRMVSANAALGTYQFQRTMTLPYMRKSLALDYAKVDLLKKIVGGISSLEKAVVNKLEAIKLNTAAVVPKKRGYIGEVFKRKREMGINRIAGNLSAAEMGWYNRIWKNRVAPVISSVHDTMVDGRPTGGINGVTRQATSQLNRLRQIVRKKAGGTLGDDASWFERLTQKAAQASEGALGGAVKLGQTTRLGEKKNSLLSSILSTGTSYLNGINPFAATGAGAIIETLNDNHQKSLGQPGEGTPGLDRLRGGDLGLQGLLTRWRKTSEARQSQLLEEVKAIRDVVAPGALRRRKKTAGGTELADPVKRKRTASAKPRKVKTTVLPPQDEPSRQLPPPLPPHIETPISTRRPRPANAPTNSLSGAMLKLFGSMGTKLGAIDAGIRQGNRTREGFERHETQRESLFDRTTAAAKVRLGSYQDYMAKRAAAQGANVTQTGASGLPLTAAGALGAAGAGGAAAGAAGSSMIPSIGTLLTGAAGALGAKALSAGRTGIKVAGKTALRGGKSVGSTLLRQGPKAAVAATSLGLKGLWKGSKLATKTGWLGAKLGTRLGLGAAGLGAAGAGGALKLLGRGAFSLAKGPLGLGIALEVGQHYFDKNTKGTVRRVGDTGFGVAQGGLLGASIGAMFGGIGAIPGAAIGAALGGVIANADYAGKALGGLASGVAEAGRGIFTTIFGQDAKVGPYGDVIQQKKPSLRDDINIAMFGQKEIRSRSGQIIQPSRLSLLGNIQYGFQKTLFGDKYDNGEYKEGTSLVAMMGASISKSLTDFGKGLAALPGRLQKGASQLGTKIAQAYDTTKKTVTTGATAAGSWLSKKSVQALQLGDKITQFEQRTAQSARTALTSGKPWTLQGLKQNLMVGATAVLSPASLTSFFVGGSDGGDGWAFSSGAISNPTSPYYGFVSQVLKAYGVKDRALYRYLRSVELSQVKVNDRQIKPFDDNDMAYMAGRFGIDTKNPDAINYFKLWYKRRFLAVMALMDRVFKAHKQTFSSIFNADEKEILLITTELNKALGSSDLLSMGLEPSQQAYLRYAKIGNADPGGKTPATGTKQRPFDPRDPKNQVSNLVGGIQKGGFGDIISKAFGKGSSGPEAAARTSAQMVKGDVKNQPEFKASYQKLSKPLKAAVDKSKALQFVLWSTSVQHGADTAVQIFQRDYSDKLDEKGNIHKIYEDRSSRFGDLNSADRIEAMRHLSQEEQFADTVGTTNPDMATMGRQLSGVINPNSVGNDSDLTNLKGAKISGTVASRAKDGMAYLMSKRYTKNAAAAIIGNLITESGLRTNAVGDSGHALGLAQWHADRRAAIAKHFGGKSVGEMDYHGQLDAVDWEIRSGSGVTGGKNLFGDLNGAQSVGAAVSMMVDRYERPAERAKNKIDRTRQAITVMQSFGNSGPGSGLDSSATQGGVGGDGNGGGKSGVQTVTPADVIAKSAGKTKSKTPAAITAAPTTAAKPTAAAATVDHSELIKAMDRNTAAVHKSAGALHNTTVVAPQAPAKPESNFLTMSFEKAKAVMGFD